MTYMDYGPNWPPPVPREEPARSRRRRIGLGVWLALAFNLGVLAVAAGLAVQAERPIALPMRFFGSPHAASAPPCTVTQLCERSARPDDQPGGPHVQLNAGGSR